MESSRVNVGPLTTVFTPPFSCSTLTLDLASNVNSVPASWGIACAHKGFDVASACYPPGFGDAYYDADADGLLVFSPGLSCPQGFYSACSLTRHPDGVPPPTSSADATLWSALNVGETAIGCCVSGFKCANEFHSESLCIYSPSRGETVTAPAFMGACPVDNIHLYTLDADKYSITPSHQRVQLVVAAPTASSGDHPLETGEPASTSGNGSSGGLSPGARIAVGVSIPFVAIVTAVILFLIFKRRRRHLGTRQVAAPEKTSHTSGGEHLDVGKHLETGKPELEASPGPTAALGGPEYSKPELDAKVIRGKLDPTTATVRGTAQELDAHAVGARSTDGSAMPFTATAVASESTATEGESHVSRELAAEISSLPRHTSQDGAGRGSSTQPPQSVQQSFNDEPWRWSEPLHVVDAKYRSKTQLREQQGDGTAPGLSSDGDPPGQRSTKSPPELHPVTGTSETPVAASSAQSGGPNSEARPGSTLEDLRLEEARLEAEINRIRDLRRLDQERAEVRRRIESLERPHTERPP